MSEAQTFLQDIRQRILAHEAAVAAGEARADEPPYTLEELKQALQAISKNRAEASTAVEAKAPRRKAGTKSVDLSDLL